MIPEDATFEKYLNHYDVIYLDITLLVGINYKKATKEHTCKIEEIIL